MAATDDNNLHYIQTDTRVVKLDCNRAFGLLSREEKLYAYHLSKASFDGNPICFMQKSRESPAIFVIFHCVFSEESPASLRAKATTEYDWTAEEFDALLLYVTAFYCNTGNYLDFGDRKFVPQLGKKKLRVLLENTAAFKNNADLLNLYDVVENDLFCLDENKKFLGYPQKGVTAFLSSNVSEQDTDFVQRFMTENQIEAWNTRLEKTTRDGKTVYVIRFASVEQREETKEFEGTTVILKYGEYSPILKRVVDGLQETQKYARNENQRNMIAKYIEHFTTGDINQHKDASRFWIRDTNPPVESYIGFIENYSDPAGTRADYEGFVACVDKDLSEKFQNLVTNSKTFIARLPWGPEYEKDTFMMPDFTALTVVNFAGGIPAGINIPNYDEIRQNEGFKNVSLSNVISSKVSPGEKITFLDDADDELYRKLYVNSFEVQVGLHELLGHGTGKLFEKSTEGKFNFDEQKVKDLLTGGPVTTWYLPGETWSSKFGALSCPYEECRAEAVGYYLCCFDDILEIFGHKGDDAKNVMYVNWMSEIRAGLVALEYFQPDSKTWGQAHCYARYVLFRVCLEAGQGFITLDRSKIMDVGFPSMQEFLKKLQGYKSTGNATDGLAFFKHWGEVSDEHLHWRDIVVKRRKPRNLFVQTKLVKNSDGSEVHCEDYEPSTAGLIQSFVERHPKEAAQELLELWKEQRSMFYD
ncbi:peptidase family m49 domain-containing protein [Ditylenchus destructor]|nr:peptidase family m49 domain-containing protein [Ditylenchus destructor]